MSGFLCFMVEIKLSTIRNHTLYLLWFFIYSPLCLFTRVACLRMCTAAVFQLASYFHVLRNEIRTHSMQSAVWLLSERQISAGDFIPVEVG